MSLRLGVNIDHVATIRNARGARYPEPIRAAELALAAGADGITAHLREDRRHIADADIDLLSDLCRRRGRPLNRRSPTRWWGSLSDIAPTLPAWFLNDAKR